MLLLTHSFLTRVKNTQIEKKTNNKNKAFSHRVTLLSSSHGPVVTIFIVTWVVGGAYVESLVDL